MGQGAGQIQEVQLPDGTRQPWLNTDFGNTITLLFGLVSPPITDAECVARANLLRERLAELRGGASSTNHAAVAAFLPPSHRRATARCSAAGSRPPSARPGWPKQVRTAQGHSFILADLETSASRADLEKFIADFTRTVTGTDRELFHPDFTKPILLMGDEDPLPQIRASAPPRYSYRTLELLARDFEDELKQVESVGKVTKVAIVQEAVYLLFSDANLAGYGLTPETVMDSIAARNAVIPGGTMRTEGRNFPVQLSGEYKTEHDMLGTMVGMSRDGAPVYLRDAFEVRRMYESPIPYKVDVLGRTGENGPLDTRRAVMVAVEMRDGKIIRHFNEDVMKVVDTMKARTPGRPRVPGAVRPTHGRRASHPSLHQLLHRGGGDRDHRGAVPDGLAFGAGAGHGHSADRRHDVGRHANAAHSPATNLHRRAHHRPGNAGGRAGRRLRRHQPRTASGRAAVARGLAWAASPAAPDGVRHADQHLRVPAAADALPATKASS